jgi:hypothetical protein
MVMDSQQFKKAEMKKNQILQNKVILKFNIPIKTIQLFKTVFLKFYFKVIIRKKQLLF